MSIYLNNPWKPVKHTIVKDENLTATLFNEGYSIAGKLPEQVLQNIQKLFNETHEMEGKDGGMFYSVYSQNLAYRKKIHQELTALLQPFLAEHFHNYKVMLSSYVVKLAGPKSEFYLHQDTTGLDEHQHSPLNLWIPLDDVDENNGCLGIVEKSHHWFSPYRSISFPAPFDGIQNTVKQYLKPLEMKKGEVLFFDNRLLHHSFANHSNKTRVAIVCGLFPKEAQLSTCFKPEYKLGGEIELIEHDDDFLITHPNFLIDCQTRPNLGKSKGFVPDDYLEISKSEFEQLCEKNGVRVYTENKFEQSECNLIGEPDKKLQKESQSILSKLKSIIYK